MSIDPKRHFFNHSKNLIAKKTKGAVFVEIN